MAEPGIRPDAVVVGGGISGLVAAHHMTRAGATVRLIEKSHRLGGKVMTDSDDGFLIEGGPDSFVAGKGSVLELVRELGLEGQVVSSRPEHRGSYVWWEGRLHPLPGGLLLMVPSRLRPLLASSLLSWRGKTRVLADLVLPRSARDGDESLESLVTRRLGREVLDRIAEPLIAGIHAAEPATMSLEASFPRFLEMEREHRSLILAARSAVSSADPGTGLSHFASFDKGMGQLVSALIEALGRGGIETGASVVRIGGGGGGYRVDMDDGTSVTAGAVILATPARATALLLADLVPEAAAVVGEIRQVATAAVTMAFRTADLPVLAGSGFVVPSVQGRRITGVSYLSQKWEGRVPSPSSTLLRVFLRRRPGQDLALSGDVRLVGVAREDLASMLGITASPLRTWVQVWAEGLHQYTLGHLDRVATAERALEGHPGIGLAGAAFHGIGLNECIASGKRAAETVLGPMGTTLPASAASRPGGSD